MEGDGATSLEKAFQAFSRFGLSKKNRDGLTLFNLDKWLRQASIVGKDVSSTTAAIIFKQLSKKRSLTIDEFRTFLEKFAEARCTSVPSLVELLTSCGAPRLTKISDIGGSSRYQPRSIWYPKNSLKANETGDEMNDQRQSKINCAIITEEFEDNRKNIKINFASYHLGGEKLSPLTYSYGKLRDKSSLKIKKRSISEIDTTDCFLSSDKNKKCKKDNFTRNSYVIIKKHYPSSFQDLVHDVNYGFASGTKLHNYIINGKDSDQMSSCCGDSLCESPKFVPGIINRKIVGREFFKSKDSLSMKDGFRRPSFLCSSRRQKRCCKNRAIEKQDAKFPILYKSDLSRKECALLMKDSRMSDGSDTSSQGYSKSLLSSVDIRQKNKKITLPGKNTFEVPNNKCLFENKVKEPLKTENSKHLLHSNGRASPSKKNLKVQFAEPVESVI